MRQTNHFGETVRTKRKILKLTGTSLASTIAISQSYISNMEKGITVPPSSAVIDRLEKILKFPPGELFVASFKDGVERLPPLDNSEAWQYFWNCVQQLKKNKRVEGVQK